jgi:hypothetical protein
VTEKSTIGESAWTFLSPGPSWTWGVVCDSEGDTCNDPAMHPPDFYDLPTPNSKCWFLGASDPSLSSPIESYPYAVGVLEYHVAEEGEIQWLIDGPNTGLMLTGFATYVFDEPGEVCTGTAATATTSWGSVKMLFR